MTTTVDTRSMIDEYESVSHLFQFGDCVGLGSVFVRIVGDNASDNDLYPGWRQYRLFGNQSFNVMGIGVGPTASMLDTWHQIDRDFSLFHEGLLSYLTQEFSNGNCKPCFHSSAGVTELKKRVIEQLEVGSVEFLSDSKWRVMMCCEWDYNSSVVVLLTNRNGQWDVVIDVY
jgi:hypothetical protein